MLALLLACAFIWTVASAQGGQGSGVLTFAVLNIGQGDALYIEGPTGIQILVDAGPNTGAVLRELPNVMPLGDRTLDAVVETHPDADHMGGFVDMLARYEVGAFIEPGVDKDNTVIAALKKEIAAHNIPVYIARRGMVLDLGGGAHLDILYPDVDVSQFGDKSNDASIVAHLVYGNTRAMLTGDAPFNIESRVIQISTAGEVTSDLLKVGHHGSKYSTSEAFVQAVHPQLALISVGAHNSYGHPTQDVLARLQAASVPVLRTDKNGRLTCMSDGTEFKCESEK